MLKSFDLRHFNHLRVVLVLPFAKESKEAFFQPFVRFIWDPFRGQSLKCLEVKEFAPQLDVAA